MLLRLAGSPGASAAPLLLGYDDVGDGMALCLLHAFPLDRRIWRSLADDLKHAQRVITLDFRGLGESQSDGRVTVDDVADDLGRLLDHLGIRRAVVGGMSMGGYVALAFARRHRARLAGLLLADTRANADDAAGRAGREEMIARVVREGARPFVAEFVPRLLTGRDPAATAAALAIAELQSAVGIAGALAALRDRPDASDLLPLLTVPAAVIVGSEDRQSPPEVARAMAAALPDCELQELPGAAHLSHLEEPRGFLAAVDRLMARVASRERDAT